MNNIEKEIENLIEPVIMNLGFKLYDVIYSKIEEDWYLSIYIDNASGIKMEDCEKVSRELLKINDIDNLISQKYILEVSSPGVERLLRKDIHFEEAINSKIQVILKDNSEYIGILKSYNDTFVTVYNNEEKIINKEDIASAKIKFF